MGVVQNAIDIKTLGEALAGIGSDLVGVKEKADNAVSWAESKGYIGKNILNNTLTTTTDRGVTFTVNADKSISLSGALDNQHNVVFLTMLSNATLPVGKYVLSGCPEGGSITTYHQYLVINRDGSNIKKYDTGSGVEFEIKAGDIVNLYSPRIDSGYQEQSVTGLVFKPMIRLASVLDDTYEQHLPSNNELVPLSTLKSVTASAADFAAFKTAIAAL